MFKNFVALSFYLICLSLVQGFDYPASKQIEHVDVYHGIEVKDPYRWLEEDIRGSDHVNSWVEAQNEVTFKYLRSLRSHEQIKKRLTEIWNYEKYSTPQKHAGRYYISKNNGLQNHYVVYVSDSLKGKKRVLFDPNKWSKDGSVSLAGNTFSKDGKYVAYGIQESGSDWRTWKVRDIETGRDISDELKYLKFTSPAWSGDSKGFFYGKFPDPDPGREFISLNKDMKLMYHRIGTEQSEDTVVLYRPDHPEWGYNADVTDDGRFLVVTIWIGTDEKYRIIYKDLSNPYAMGIDLIPTFENDYTFIDNDGSVFYFLTDYLAGNKRVIAIDTDNPKPENWKEIIPQADEPLQSVNLVGGKFVCRYLKDVSTEVRVFGIDGGSLGNIELPGIGAAGGFAGKKEDMETFYSFQSYATAPSIYRYDFKNAKSTLIERPTIDFDFENYVTEQKFYRSKDGTRVPMFITHKKSMKLDGSNPTILYGYGGFNISLLPYFSLSSLIWMEMGGVYAVANLRGGGEYGQKWHESGKRMKKQNVFDDFIAAAEYLIENKYTRSEKLAIRGGSNGGLLVGACITQRPELFAAAVPAVGVMDMLRFDEFTAGRYWVDEYGSAKESKEMFEYLKGYSPYHNIRKGVKYPATLITTAETDDRVVPSHSFKFAAKLQHCHSGDSPVYIRIQRKIGHGSGKPTSMIIEELADIYAFLKKNLRMN